MANKKEVLKQNIFTTAVIMAVVIGTIFVMFAIPPEERHIKSSDGQVNVLATVGEASQVTIGRLNEIARSYTAAVSPVYNLKVSEGVAIQPITVEILLNESWAKNGEIINLSLMSYDASSLAWKLLPTTYDTVDQKFSTIIPVNTIISDPFLIAVGDVVKYELPERASVIVDELTSFPPEGAIGYRLYASYATVPGDFVMINSNIEYGGCDGRFRSGKRTTMTSRDISVNEITFRIGVIWELDGGCVERERVERAEGS